MKVAEFIAKLKDIANNYNTLYVMGCFGAPLTGANVKRYQNNCSYNKQTERTEMIKAVANKTPPYYGFDCVCLIKGILWGWNGSQNKTYGGATYTSNKVPDIGADTMITKCSDISTDFSNIEIGEAVWCKGHIGVYIGDGLVVECTPKWKNCVQITALKNIGSKSGYDARMWTKHGKLPYIEYEETTPTVTVSPATEDLEYAVGDVVQFTGCLHYTSSYKSGVAKGCKAGVAKVTAISKGKPHPYQLKAVAGKGSTVYGWVNASDIAGKATSTKTKTYTVVKGDTLSKIAKNCGTTIDTLVKLNGITDKNLIRVGQIIKLP